MLARTMTQEGGSYDAAIRAAMAKVAEVAASRPPSVAELASRLLTSQRIERRDFLSTLPTATLPDLVQLLLARGWTLRGEDAVEALRITKLALEAALRAVRAFPRPALAADLVAEAWAQLASLNRMRGRFTAADFLWQRAHRALQHGTGDRALLIETLGARASLKRYQRRFDEASDLLRAALRFQRELDDPQGEGRLRNALSIVYSYSGKPQKAFDEVLSALELLDPGRDPELHFRAVHNSVLYLAELGRNTQGLLMACALEAGYELFASQRFLLHGRWVKGRLHARCHERADAIEYLDSVRLGFQKEGLVYEAALATLDLALVYAEEHDLRKVKQLVEEMYPVFVDKAVPGEAAASLVLFADSARRAGATAAQVSKLIDQLHALRLH